MPNLHYVLFGGDRDVSHFLLAGLTPDLAVLPIPPPAADSSAIDAALMALLKADATLMALMPQGVYWAEGSEGLSRFIKVSLVDEDDAPMFGGCAFENALYLVEAIQRATGTDTTIAAAARIRVLLDGQPLVVAGYACMTMHREKRVRDTEVDDVDTAIRFYHGGGEYRVVMSAT